MSEKSEKEKTRPRHRALGGIKIPSRDEVGLDVPLRLSVAATLAFPDQSMTASGLRKEVGRGRLALERVAGKDYTTLAAIEKMRELCRQKPKDRDCGSENRDEASTVHSHTEACG